MKANHFGGGDRAVSILTVIDHGPYERKPWKHAKNRKPICLPLHLEAIALYSKLPGIGHQFNINPHIAGFNLALVGRTYKIKCFTYPFIPGIPIEITCII